MMTEPVRSMPINQFKAYLDTPQGRAGWAGRVNHDLRGWLRFALIYRDAMMESGDFDFELETKFNKISIIQILKEAVTICQSKYNYSPTRDEVVFVMHLLYYSLQNLSDTIGLEDVSTWAESLGGALGLAAREAAEAVEQPILQRLDNITEAIGNLNVEDMDEQQQLAHMGLLTELQQQLANLEAGEQGENNVIAALMGLGGE
jgi:hypothetical protein